MDNDNKIDVLYNESANHDELTPEQIDAGTYKDRGEVAGFDKIMSKYGYVKDKSHKHPNPYAVETYRNEDGDSYTLAFHWNMGYHLFNSSNPKHDSEISYEWYRLARPQHISYYQEHIRRLEYNLDPKDRKDLNLLKTQLKKFLNSKKADDKEAKKLADELAKLEKNKAKKIKENFMEEDIITDIDSLLEDTELDAETKEILQEAKAKKEAKMKEDEGDDKSDEDESDDTDSDKNDEDSDKKDLDEDKDSDKDDDKSDEDESDEDKEEGDKDSEKNESAITYQDDLKALTESDESLTEEFKEKAAIIFEAALNDRVKVEKTKLEEQFSINLNEETTRIYNEISEKVDDYLTYAVESWVEDNKIAIESGLRTEIAESFMRGLQNVFVEHYIEVPESKKNVVSELETRLVKVEEALCEADAKAKSLTEQNEKLLREKIITEASNGLADTQAARLQSLVEDLEFCDEATYTKKVKTIKETYFKGKKDEVIEEETDSSKYHEVTEVIVENANDDVDPAMKQYLQVLEKVNKASK